MFPCDILSKKLSLAYRLSSLNVNIGIVENQYCILRMVEGGTTRMVL